MYRFIRKHLERLLKWWSADDHHECFFQFYAFRSFTSLCPQRANKCLSTPKSEEFEDQTQPLRWSIHIWCPNELDAIMHFMQKSSGPQEHDWYRRNERKKSSGKKVMRHEALQTRRPKSLRAQLTHNTMSMYWWFDNQGQRKIQC